MVSAKRPAISLSILTSAVTNVRSWSPITMASRIIEDDRR